MLTQRSLQSHPRRPAAHHTSVGHHLPSSQLPLGLHTRHRSQKAALHVVRAEKQPSEAGSEARPEPSASKPPQPQQPGQPQATPSTANGTGPGQPDMLDEVDRQMSGAWEDLRKEMKRGVDPDTAQFLDTITYEELTTTDPRQFMRKFAEVQLGPILASMGLNVDPYEFVVELIKVSVFIQFVTCGMVWFGAQGIGHLGTGAAWSATLGLVLGYLTRPAFKVELLLYPVYNSVIQVFLPNAVFEVPASTSDQVQDTFNRIGIALALAFLLPQFLLGWDAQESVTVVAPMCAGWFLFDLTFLAGLLLLVQFPSDDAR